MAATGTAPLRYQWKKNGLDILGATKPFYTTLPTTVLDNNSVFSVNVSNKIGSVMSNGAILTVR